MSGSGWSFRPLPLTLAAVAGVGLVGLFAIGLGRDARAIPSPLPGREAPEFELEVLFSSRPALPNGPAPGDTIRLPGMNAEVVVVNFWASWCLACRQEHAALSAVAERHRDDGVRFFGILYQDTPGNADRYLDEMGGQAYPTLLDPGSRTAISFGLYGVPETYIINAAGVVIAKHVGPVTESGLEEYIREGRRATPATAPPSPSAQQP